MDTALLYKTLLLKDVILLSEKGLVNIENINNENISLLYIACKQKNKEVIKYLISKGANINNGYYNNSPLMECCCNRSDLDIIKFLLDCKPHLEYKDTFGCTAFMFSIFYKRLDVAQLLLDRGADINAFDNEMWNSAMTAAIHNNSIAIKFLIDNGADLYHKNDKGKTLLECFSCKNKKLYFEKYIEDINIVNIKPCKY
jgi:ankyrin repeat protein